MIKSILKKELGLYPYRITQQHALLLQDLPVRVNLANWILLLEDFYQAQGWDLVGKIWWSDEDKFYLHGSVNSYNARHCGATRPNPQQRPPQNSPKLKVWAICQHWFIGPFFFEDPHSGPSVNVEYATWTC